MPSQVPRVKSDVSKMLDLSDKQSRDKQNFIFRMIHEPHIGIEIQHKSAHLLFQLSSGLND